MKKRSVAIALILAALTLLASCVRTVTDKTAEKKDTETQKSDIKVGGTYGFGSYEQDGDTSNGKEPIEWMILEIVGNKALMISVRSLDCKPFNDTKTDVTWETCSLRKWLNGEFLSEAFSPEEQSRIADSKVAAEKNPYPDFNASPGNDTTDKVFVFSIDEAFKYLEDRETRLSVPTDYAKSQGAWINEKDGFDEKGFGLWWLRTPGSGADHAAVVSYSSLVYYDGYVVDNDKTAVRPVLRIDLGD